MSKTKKSKEEKRKADLVNTLLIFAAAGCMIISIGAIIQGKFREEYHWLMFSFGCFFFYTYRRVQGKDKTNS